MTSSIVYLIGGLAAIPAFTFQEHLLLKTTQLVITIVFVLASGRKVKPVPMLIMLVAVTVTHLITPSGRVLFRIAGSPITLGSLEAGLDKALLVLGLVSISRFCVRAEGLLRKGGDSLPGLVMIYFERLTARSRLWSRDLTEHRRGLIGWIDELLLSVESGNGSEAAVAPDPGGGDAGAVATGVNASAHSVVASVAFAGLHWAFFLLGRLGGVPDFGALLLGAMAP